MEAETTHPLGKYMWILVNPLFPVHSYIFQDKMKQFLVDAFWVI